MENTTHIIENILTVNPELNGKINSINPENVVENKFDAKAALETTIPQINSRLKITKKMNVEVNILIPTTINLDQPCDTHPYIELCKQLLTDVGGGSMAQYFDGTYKTHSDRYVSEGIVEVKGCMTETEFFLNLGAIINFIELILVELNQESVFLSVKSESTTQAVLVELNNDIPMAA